MSIQERCASFMSKFNFAAADSIDEFLLENFADLSSDDIAEAIVLIAERDA